MPTVHPPDDADALTDAPIGAGNERLLRWVDILAALLGRRKPASFRALARDVPEYLRKLQAADGMHGAARTTAMESLKRAFERDKDELRTLGIPIETSESVDDDGQPVSCYQLRTRDFYMPYLSVVAPSHGASTPKRIHSDGYQALSQLVLEPEELAAIVNAAASIRSLGDTVLRADVDSAMRKLAVDLPLEGTGDTPDVPRVITERVQPDAKVFATLSDALQHRKSVAFTYHSLTSDRTSERVVDPYGLFFMHGHWYLAAHDHTEQALRNFRLRRMEKPSMQNTKLQTADFTIPASFSLRDHARPRQAWELGDDARVDVIVDFHGQSGPTLAAAALGQPVDAHPAQRRFTVRRSDSFARWVLACAGEARIVSPPAFAEQVRFVAEATRVLYDREAPTEMVPPSATMPLASGARKPWEPKGAAAQLRRLLLVMPQIADGEEHAIEEVAARIGCDVATLTRDLHSLAPRYDLPGGFVEGVQVYIGAGKVSGSSQRLQRPMRLTMSELCAMDLGLAVLRTHRPPEEHALLDSARRRLKQVIAGLRDDPVPDLLYTVSLGAFGSIDSLADVRDGLRTRTKLRIGYRKSGSVATDERVVRPYALLSARGMMYLVAHCDRNDAIRIFRMDRVSQVSLLSDTFEPADYDLDEVTRDGRVFQEGDHEMMLVRYSPRISRWIAEREQRMLDDDGSVVLDHPLADAEWAVRHVLQYGADAEVLSPAWMRTRLRDTLDAMQA
ncbi:MAG: WYL domain-containing protein [Gemmatimonadota bacterium]